MQSSLLAYLSKEASTKFQSSTSLRDGRTGNTWGNESQDDDQEIHNTKKMNNSAKGKLNSSRNIKRLPPGKPAERKKITLEDLELEKIDNDPILLSSKQYEVIEAILNHQSVFFTGAAGTGSSKCTISLIHPLRKIIYPTST